MAAVLYVAPGNDISSMLLILFSYSSKHFTLLQIFSVLFSVMLLLALVHERFGRRVIAHLDGWYGLYKVALPTRTVSGPDAGQASRQSFFTDKDG